MRYDNPHDRFAVCQAYALYTWHWNKDGLTRRDRSRRTVRQPWMRGTVFCTSYPRRKSIMVQLSRLRFRDPGLDYEAVKRVFRAEHNTGEYDSVRERYLALIERHEGPAAAMREADEMNDDIYVHDSEITLWQARQLIRLGHSATLGARLAGHAGEHCRLLLRQFSGTPFVVLELDEGIVLYPVLMPAGSGTVIDNCVCPKCGSANHLIDMSGAGDVTCTHCTAEGGLPDFQLPRSLLVRLTDPAALPPLPIGATLLAA